MMKIKILGAGSWGTALALLLNDNGHDVSLWSWDSEQVKKIEKESMNKNFLPGIRIPRSITFSDDYSDICESDIILVSVPSQAIHEVMQKVKDLIRPETIIVNTSKGLYTEKGKRLSQVIKETLSDNPVMVLSGPSHAEEVARRLSTAVVLAGDDIALLRKVQDIFMNDYFRVYLNEDITGVEIGGALKNIIALGTGILTGLGLGDNAQAAVMTRGLVEITRFGIAMGAESTTFSGLSGLGDLIVTCGSMHSRNRRAGIEIGKGFPWREVVKNMGMVVEGVYVTEIVYKLAQEMNIEMPITEQIYAMLYEDLPPKLANLNLMTRTKTQEFSNW